MDILEFYLNQQQYKDWYVKFQSTGQNKSGKIFSYINTNYRCLKAFFAQLTKFEKNNGVERCNWGKYSSGQEEDKHRIVNLVNSNMVSLNMDRYYLTNIGYTCKDLIDADLSNQEKWILLYIILLNYKYEGKFNDIVVTAKEFMNYLFVCGLKEEYLFEEIKTAIRVNDLERLFKLDIFWYITFAKDKQFVENYMKSSEEERLKLQEYVIQEQKKEKSKDCIGHKYVDSGAYNKNMFLEEIEVLYYSYILSKHEFGDFEDFVNKLLNLYLENHRNANRENILKFINEHKSVYEYIYSQFKF